MSTAQAAGAETARQATAPPKKGMTDRAKALLAESRLPLAEVGLRTGFSHQSHFTRLFRRLTGTTPQSYRLLMSRA